MAGMIAGIVIGNFMGVIMMCLMVAGKREDEQMEQICKKRAQEGKCWIAFPHTANRAAFRIEDGQSIRMVCGNGDGQTELCRYLDPAHAEIGGTVWELQGFIHTMEARGITCLPS